MDRRELLKKIAFLTGGVVVGGEFFLSGCRNETSSGFILSSADINLLDEIAETIIPATDTPGAKAAKLGEFMRVMVSDCYTPKEQSSFFAGIQSINEYSIKQTKKKFIDCSEKERLDLLTELEKQAKKYNEEKAAAAKLAIENSKEANKQKPDTTPHYYTMMKQLTLWGFFTSQTGMTQTLRYIPVPGKYQGDMPYHPGDKAWAE